MMDTKIVTRYGWMKMSNVGGARITKPSSIERVVIVVDFFFSSRRRHTISLRDWSSDVCSSDLVSRSGAAHLFVSDDYLHIRDLDFVLPELTCIKPPHLQTKRASRPQRRSTPSNTSSFARLLV